MMNQKIHGYDVEGLIKIAEMLDENPLLQEVLDGYKEGFKKGYRDAIDAFNKEAAAQINKIVSNDGHISYCKDAEKYEFPKITFKSMLPKEERIEDICAERYLKSVIKPELIKKEGE